MRNRQLSARNRPRHQKRSRLDSVRNHGMFRPVQFLHAANPQRRCPIAANLRPHFSQHHDQVRHFRLPCRILQNRFPVRQYRRHQYILRSRHRNFLEHDARALQPSPSRTVGMHFRFNVPVRCSDFRAHLFQRLQVQIHGPRPNRASPRQRNSRHSHARHQRPQRQHGRPHRLHQLVRRFRVIQFRRLDHVIAARKLRYRHFSVHERQQLAHGDQVTHFRDVVQCHLLHRQQGRRHHRQRRILRPADRHRPPQRLPALDPKFIHPASRLFLVEATLCRHPSFSDSSLLCVLCVSALSSLSLTPQAHYANLLPSVFSSPRVSQSSASASPAQPANRVPPPSERVPPQTNSSRSPPPESAAPVPPASHSSASCRSSSSHTHAPVAPSPPYSAC